MVPTWLRRPRERGYFYTSQESKLSYADTTPACQLVGGFFVLFYFVFVSTPQEQANSQTSLDLVLQVSL